MDYQKVLEDIYTEVKPYRRAGHQADYIPALERVNPRPVWHESDNG